MNEEKKKLDNKDDSQVSYAVWESSMARADNRHKWNIGVIVFLIVLLFASNMIWLYVFQSYEYTDETITVDSKDGGYANYLGGNGDIHNGIGDSLKADTTQEKR